MAREPRLETDRLILRRWRDSDLGPFAALNRDPEVMEYFTGTLTESETAEMIERIEAHFEERGFGLWALEEKASGDFFGFAGLSVPRFEAHFTPAVEVGWRFARSHWGKGYATEAARRAMDFGFTESELEEIVSFATPANVRSLAVMRRLGMSHDPSDDFDHPKMTEASGLRRHALYRMSARQWPGTLRPPH